MKISIRNKHFIVNEGNQRQTFDYINSGNWEPYTFEIFDYFINEDNVVFDLGCWHGITSLYLAHLSKKTYAIDPDPICFEELLKNVDLNPTLGAKIPAHQIAISNKAEKMKLFARENYGASSSSILKRNRDEKKTVEVNCMSLQEFINKENIPKVDFLKIDIEGAEFLILPYIKAFLEQTNYPTLYISFHYHFLNENEYSKLIASKVITKTILKLESIFNFSFLKNKLKKRIHHLFDDLSKYQYIYTQNGDLILYNDLLKNPTLIKNNELIFTNKKWVK